MGGFGCIGFRIYFGLFDLVFTFWYLFWIGFCGTGKGTGISGRAKCEVCCANITVVSTCHIFFVSAIGQN